MPIPDPSSPQPGAGQSRDGVQGPCQLRIDQLWPLLVVAGWVREPGT